MTTAKQETATPGTYANPIEGGPTSPVELLSKLAQEDVLTGDEGSALNSIAITAEKQSLVESEEAIIRRILRENFVPKINPAYHFPEVTADICLDLQENEEKIMLVGHTGTGKTSLMEQIYARLGEPLIRANMNGNMTIGDFLGFWTVVNGATVWVDGILPLAMKYDCGLLLDEFDFAEAFILSPLHPVLEPHGKLLLKERGMKEPDKAIVTPGEKFRLIGTANTVGKMARFRPIYQGTNEINEATLDRWKVYEIRYLPPDAETQVLVNTVPKMTPTIARHMVDVANLCRDSFEKEDYDCTFSTRRLLSWARQTIRKKNPLLGADSTIFSKISSEDAAAIEEVIKRVLRVKDRTPAGL